MIPDRSVPTSAMKPAPAMIDGARVIYWADTRGILKTDACTFLADGRVQQAFAGLAIAQYEGESSCCLFLCDEQWETQNDTLHHSVDEARAFAESLYPAVSVRWRAAAASSSDVSAEDSGVDGG